MELGVKPIHVGAATDPADRINATRQLLPVVYFNDTPRVRLGLSHLRRYSRKLNQQMGTYTGILHDEHSHAADAFGEFAINCAIRPPKKPVEPKLKAQPGQVVLPGPPEPVSSRRIKI
jgi:hypothetical protein